MFSHSDMINMISVVIMTNTIKLISMLHTIIRISY